MTTRSLCLTPPPKKQITHSAGNSGGANSLALWKSETHLWDKAAACDQVCNTFPLGTDDTFPAQVSQPGRSQVGRVWDSHCPRDRSTLLGREHL